MGSTRVATMSAALSFARFAFRVADRLPAGAFFWLAVYVPGPGAGAPVFFPAPLARLVLFIQSFFLFVKTGCLRQWLGEFRLFRRDFAAVYPAVVPGRESGKGKGDLFAVLALHRLGAKVELYLVVDLNGGSAGVGGRPHIEVAGARGVRIERLGHGPVWFPVPAVGVNMDVVRAAWEQLEFPKEMLLRLVGERLQVSAGESNLPCSGERVWFGVSIGRNAYASGNESQDDDDPFHGVLLVVFRKVNVPETPSSSVSPSGPATTSCTS